MLHHAITYTSPSGREYHTVLLRRRRLTLRGAERILRRYQMGVIVTRIEVTGRP